MTKATSLSKSEIESYQKILDKLDRMITKIDNYLGDTKDDNKDKTSKKLSSNKSRK